ncbi:unnamed protein product [Bursaphelenchus okinawaensis]|uniref:ShKT domain-containing protein n=1 Tax=Bursaphelenchus okinawaensis TaxID=465554 RepID=A0A811LE17_9BILA|nr:unnamed protein product [Bursaphelenchus okinawaensis]CAG9121326.1 unnamed protein product [Bursaphelenchus okinawaensis]
MSYRAFLLVTILANEILAWPDGAPCIHAAFESMNPLEAVEHQGGLQLSPPPFTIDTEQKCYWRNQPVQITLRGNTTEEFKGFAIQPFVWKGSKAGRRIGQFLRLDNNGSWRQQCFKNKDSVTHSHDEKKKKMMLWWKNDEDDESYVQFVATVVVSLKQFWVKSVLSAPLPPCRVEKEVAFYQPPAVTQPPAAGQFKIQTFHMFNQGDTSFLERSLSNQNFFRPAPARVAPLPPPPTTPAPIVRQPPPAISPAPFTARPSPVVQPRIFTTAQPIRQPVVNQQRLSHISPNSQSNIAPAQVCRDQDQSNRCTQWVNFCRTSTYMQTFCRRTCRFC